PKVLAALVQRAAVCDGSGYFLDPSHKPPIRFRLDDGVVALLHNVIVGKPRETGQVKALLFRSCTDQFGRLAQGFQSRFYRSSDAGIPLPQSIPFVTETSWLVRSFMSAFKISAGHP